MPSPGASDLANALAPIDFLVKGGWPSRVDPTSETIQRLSAAMDTGWTCASPVTPSTMAITIASEFADFVVGPGLDVMTAIGTGIDTEVLSWTSSWDSNHQKHLYKPSAASVYDLIMANSPVDSEGTRALARRVANVFVDHFEQEVG